MKLLVTGGLGFIGSNFILKLLKHEDIEITNIDAELYGSDHRNLAQIKNSDRYNFVKGNISNKKLMEAVGQIKQKFESVHLMNAKLFYINKALMDASMNERQKEQIVESINNVDSIESAKIVFEALRSTVGTSNDRGPKSLSEAVNKRNSSSILLHSRKKEEKTNNTDDFTVRMRRLAGIE